MIKEYVELKEGMPRITRSGETPAVTSADLLLDRRGGRDRRRAARREFAGLLLVLGVSVGLMVFALYLALNGGL